MGQVQLEDRERNTHTTKTATTLIDILRNYHPKEMTLKSMKTAAPRIIVAAVALLCRSAQGFLIAPSAKGALAPPLPMSTMAESGVPPATSESSDVEEVTIPTSLPSDKGIDYVPLATMLATGQLAEADQVCLEFWK